MLGRCTCTVRCRHGVLCGLHRANLVQHVQTVYAIEPGKPTCRLKHVTASTLWSSSHPLHPPLLLQVIRSLETETDINQELSFFSYEHFYVLYCKFWELDTDHDLVIDAKDLSRHEDHGVSLPLSQTHTRTLQRCCSYSSQCMKCPSIMT